jgi:hypothetical protein
MRDTPFEHFAAAHGDMEEVRDPRLLFNAKNLPIPAIRGYGCAIATSPRDTPQRLASADKLRTGFLRETRTLLAPPKANGTNWQQIGVCEQVQPARLVYGRDQYAGVEGRAAP